MQLLKLPLHGFGDSGRWEVRKSQAALAFRQLGRFDGIFIP